MDRRLPPLKSFLRLAFCAACSLLATIMLGLFLTERCTSLISYGRGVSPQAVAANNLRQIGQASLIFALDNHDQLPTATDLPDYARQLAISSGLNEAYIWVKTDTVIPRDGTIVLGDYDTPPEKRLLNPAFAKLPHVVTVPLNGINVSMPATTPIAWTRGLDFEHGVWSPDSPNIGEGGHIVFLDCTVRYYRSLATNGGELRRFSDGRPTAKLLEALPPGTRTSDPSAHLSPEQIPSANKQKRDLTLAQISENIRSAIMPACAIWMLVLFPTLTLLLHRYSTSKTFKVPVTLVIALFATPVLLLTLSVIFRV